ncbi:MAG: Ig-like domain-containing protein [Verrucomicrobiota bacterium]
MKAMNQSTMRLGMGCALTLSQTTKPVQKSRIKLLPQWGFAGLLAGLLLPQAGLAQLRSQITIDKPSSAQLRLTWTSQTGTDYQADFAEELDVFGLWSPEGNPLTAAGASVQTTFTQPTNSQRFYRVRGLPDDGFPVVRIVSPTNGASLGGPVTVTVGAADDRRLSAVTLYLDGQPLQTKTTGDLLFEFDSAHYANGSHEIYAVAQDNAGISYLGGDPNANTVFNETQSVTHALDFQNVLRWINADHLFDSTVSIIAESDIFPTNYTVFVEDAAGNTVRVFTEQTLDGSIQTSWDGLDGFGNPVPEEQPYVVILALGNLSSPPAVMMSAGGAGFKASRTVSSEWKWNKYGYQDLEVTLLMEPPPTPPLPPKVVKKDGRYVVEQAPVVAESAPGSILPSKLVKRTYSIRQVCESTGSGTTASLGLQSGDSSASGPTPANADGGSSASTTSVYWKETPWQSGQLLLARQILTQAPTIWNTEIANLLVNIMNQVNVADIEIGPNRNVYQNLRLACSTPTDYTQLLSLLNVPSIRNFYYSGHTSGNGIGYSDSVPTSGITVTNLAQTLTNYTSVIKGSPLKVYFQFRKPFRFVYMDGCESANGWLPEAFGIPIEIKNGYKSRAFMGWKTHGRMSLLNDDHRLFTERFWNRWVGDKDYTKPLSTAITQALTSTPSVAPSEIRTFGSVALRWEE